MALSSKAHRRRLTDADPERTEIGDTSLEHGSQREASGPTGRRRRHTAMYPRWFYLPGALIYLTIFAVPTAISFFFAFTRWNLYEWEWIGFDNFRQFFREPALTNGLRNTVIYAVVTTTLKVVFGMALAVLVTSRMRLKGLTRSVLFFPTLVSTVAIGITFREMMHPTDGVLNEMLGIIGIDGPFWLTDPSYALLSVALVEAWRGVGLSMVIFIAGISAIPDELYEAVSVDGAGAWDRFRYVTLPLSKPAAFTVVLLSFIGGLRHFDLIWTMTGGGPGFTTDVLASTVYKQYQSGFYGLSTAGNVVLFLLVTVLVFPLNFWMRRKELSE